MSHACHRFWKRYKTLTFSSLLIQCTIPCACHAKRQLNAQKWSKHVVFLTFWLGDVLRAATGCTFSTSQLPKVVRESCVLCILTWKCASRRSGVQRHGSAPAALASLLFDPPEPQIIGKNTVFRDFSNFFCAPASSFFSLFLWSSLFGSSPLWHSPRLCFSICSCCRKCDF